MVSQHLVSSNIASKALQGNLIILELGSSSGGWFSNQKELNESIFHFEAWPYLRTSNSKPQRDTLPSSYTEVYVTASRKL